MSQNNDMKPEGKPVRITVASRGDGALLRRLRVRAGLTQACLGAKEFPCAHSTSTFS